MKQLLTTLLILFLPVYIFAQPKNYPVPPKTQNRLFYIQRNLNENTIIYDANFDKNGNIIEDNPVDVYWIRYQEEGQRMELRMIEKKLAFGEKCKKLKSMPEYYLLKLAAAEDKELLLKQIKPFKAVVYIKINNQMSVLNHLYIFADNSGIWPDVKYMELYGKSIKSGKKMYEKIINP